eukprot:CAMPEP_0181324054 /NCGR_PEP_ID=MMETSP1101-20121128/20134_1 /TAXON_ID=46948 /ORGANISM="Rhodomonas abbreviata, Strain Caron Lab Isolate" /LENGTH=169 /DNA_ID=CAMNT_0023432163 /DNA_START=519 /DNA_END=1028 /DNA_ORIENTATION=+
MSASTPLLHPSSTPSTAKRTVAVAAGVCAIFLAAVALSDLSSKGSAATELAFRPVGTTMLYDAALEPLYTEGEAIEPYTWADANGAMHDPEQNNVYADLPMTADSIFDPDDEFRGLAPKDLSKSCDKTDSCVPEENVLEYLPDAEARNMANAAPHVDPVNVWEDITLDY